MYKLTAFLFSFAAGCFFAVSQTASPYVIASGGGYVVNAGHTNSWTVGQMVTQTLVNGGNLLTQGFQQPEGGVKISGAIISEMNTPVRTVTIQLSGDGTKSIVTGNDGLYSLDVAAGGDFTVAPSKNNDITVANGITTFDIILMQRKILAIQDFGSPYKIIAADVNASSSVSTLDIVLLRTLILGNASTFPNGRLWVFVPDDFVFANPLNPFPFVSSRSYADIIETQSAQNFIGIKLGDVNNSWDPNTPKTGAVGEVRFMMDEYDVKTGDEITVPVKVKDFNAIAGYQFTLTWDAEVLSLLEVNNKVLQGFYGENQKSRGMLTTSWNDPAGYAVTLDDEAVVFELKFKVEGASGSFSAVTIGTEPTPSEAYNGNLDLLSIESSAGIVKVGDVAELNAQRSTLNTIHLSVQPNPFSYAAVISFTIPGDNTVSITVYDLPGRHVKEMTGFFKAGKHHIEWTGDDNAGEMLSNGLYHLRITAGDFSEVRKVVRMK